MSASDPHKRYDYAEGQAYCDGFRDGINEAHASHEIIRNKHRVFAFAAIRRAVEEARWYDRRAEASFNEITKVGYNPYATTAMAIRLAIRAAIGSPKA